MVDVFLVSWPFVWFAACFFRPYGCDRIFQERTLRLMPVQNDDEDLASPLRRSDEAREECSGRAYQLDSENDRMLSRSRTQECAFHRVQLKFVGMLRDRCVSTRHSLRQRLTAIPVESVSPRSRAHSNCVPILTRWGEHCRLLLDHNREVLRKSARLFDAH